MNEAATRCNGDCDRITLTVPETARRMGISVRTVRALVASGELRSSLVGGRRLITIEAIKELLAEREIPVGAAS